MPKIPQKRGKNPGWETWAQARMVGQVGVQSGRAMREPGGGLASLAGRACNNRLGRKVFWTKAAWWMDSVRAHWRALGALRHPGGLVGVCVLFFKKNSPAAKFEGLAMGAKGGGR
jgi:hypothetical protein